MHTIVLLAKTNVHFLSPKTRYIYIYIYIKISNKREEQVLNPPIMVWFYYFTKNPLEDAIISSLESKTHRNT